MKKKFIVMFEVEDGLEIDKKLIEETLRDSIGKLKTNQFNITVYELKI